MVTLILDQINFIDQIIKQITSETGRDFESVRLERLTPNNPLANRYTFNFFPTDNDKNHKNNNNLVTRVQYIYEHCPNQVLKFIEIRNECLPF